MHSINTKQRQLRGTHQTNLDVPEVARLLPRDNRPTVPMTILSLGPHQGIELHGKSRRRRRLPLPPGLPSRLRRCCSQVQFNTSSSLLSSLFLLVLKLLLLQLLLPLLLLLLLNLLYFRGHTTIRCWLLDRDQRHTNQCS